jgi:hypothetical protein
MNRPRSARGVAPTFGELVMGLACGFALWGLTYYGTIDAIGNVKHALEDGDDEGISPSFNVYELSFEIGGTEIYYGQTLAALTATVILVAIALLVFRRRRAHAETCPHCLSEVPAGAAVCANCTRDVAPAAQ